VARVPRPAATAFGLAMTEPRPDPQILAEWALVLTLNFGIWALVLWWLLG
jgi:hypothetical protein